MNKRKQIIIKRYAEAFFLSIEEDDFEECFKDFEAFNAIYFGFDGFRDILNHPTIHTNRKLEMLQRVFGEQAKPKVLHFICMLLRRERMDCFEGIALEVERFYRRKNGIRGVIVKSPVPLTTTERDQLRELLTRKLGRIEIREKIDPYLIGGLVIHFGDQVIDESVRAKLKLLRELMIRVDNEWMATLINQPSIAI